MNSPHNATKATVRCDRQIPFGWLRARRFQQVNANNTAFCPTVRAGGLDCSTPVHTDAINRNHTVKHGPCILPGPDLDPQELCRSPAPALRKGRKEKGGPEARLSYSCDSDCVSPHLPSLFSLASRYRPTSAWPRRSPLRLSQQPLARLPYLAVQTWYPAGYLP